LINPEDVAQVLEELKPYFTTIVRGPAQGLRREPERGCWVSSSALPMPEDLEISAARIARAHAEPASAITLMLIEINDQDETHAKRTATRTEAPKLSQIAGAFAMIRSSASGLELQFGEPVPDEEAAAARWCARYAALIAARSSTSNEDAAKVFRELLADYDKAQRGD
jgi:hypothetical protein